jgi:hypothetical protein
MKTKLIFAGLSALVVAALGINPAAAVDFSVTITNTTHASYFTPLLITAHADAAHLFELGQPASTELQAMAEGGDISGLETDVGVADADTVANPAAGLLGPGATVAAQFNTDITGNPVLSLTAMILPTNDGFVGLDSLVIPQTPGIYTYALNAYDAGTEVNTESAATVPGPAAGGEGFNAVRDDMDFVRIHSGVVSGQDGLAGSALSGDHRWGDPVFKLVVTRTS